MKLSEMDRTKVGDKVYDAVLTDKRLIVRTHIVTWRNNDGECTLKGEKEDFHIYSDLTEVELTKRKAVIALASHFDSEAKKYEKKMNAEKERLAICTSWLFRHGEE